MPIFDITFSTPLLAAFRYLRSASRSVISPKQAVADHLGDRLEGEVGVHRGRPVADEEGEVVHLAGIPALDDEADPGALLLPHEVVVHRRGEQQ